MNMASIMTSDGLAELDNPGRIYSDEEGLHFWVNISSDLLLKSRNFDDSHSIEIGDIKDVWFVSSADFGAKESYVRFTRIVNDNPLA
jgi:hypothetical protein